MAPMTTHAFPLIRHLSKRVTPVLLRLPISANQVTTLSLVLGCWAGWVLTMGGQAAALQASTLLIAAYILDNCDGEVARARGQSSKFGAALDDFADWVVHSLFFLGLGWGHALVSGDAYWWWFGIAAAVGGTINYARAQWFSAREAAAPDADSGEQPALPTSVFGWLLFAFRELARADFCFLALILAAVDLLWLLLPAAAIGAQVYWLTGFVREARRYHV